MQTTIVKPEEVKAVKTKINKMQELVLSVDITDSIAVKTMAGNIKKMLDYLEDKKEALVKPAKQIIEEARLTYDPYIVACKDAKGVLTKRATDHVLEEQRKAREEEDKIAKKAAEDKKKIEAQLAEGKISEEKATEKLQAKEEQAVEKMSEVKEVGKTHGGINVRMIKQAVIFDQNLIPDQYWVVDEVAVRKAALAGVEIPGVKVEEVASGALRG